ncbi:MAG: STE24 endopeptidase [Natronomonas sp.]|jgi:STE24 endopeptidase
MATLVAGVLFVVLLAGTEAFFTVLSALNLRHQERTVAAEREWVVEELGIDDPERALAYERVSAGVGALRSWVTLGVLLLVLFSGVFGEATAALAGLDSVLLETAVFVAGVLLATRLVGVPFDLVETFVVEEIYGFNERSLGLWLRDWTLQTVVSAALVVPLGVAVVWFVTTVPVWPAAAWALAIGAIVAFTVLKPRVIDPLFYDFEPLGDGDLKAAVDAVFDAAGYRTEQVYEMNASTRTGHSNAYFVGFGPAKRVVLYDTLVDGMDTAAIQSVLAHELAHWREGHIWKFIGLAALRLAVVFAALGGLVASGIVYFPVAAPQTPYVGLFLGVLLLAPLNRLTSPLENYVSLQYERDADAYAVEVTDGAAMARALSTLASDNLSVPFPHPWYETFHYDHPPIPERIRRVRTLADRPDDGQGDRQSGSDPSAGD